MAWKLTHETVVLKLRHAFTISTGSSTERMTVVVRLEDGHSGSGLGEATPVRYLSGTPEATGALLDAIGSWVEASTSWLESRLEVAGAENVGEAINEIDQTVREKFPDAGSALTGFNIALCDLVGRRLGLDLGELLGVPSRPGPATSYTVGIEDLEGSLARVSEAHEAGLGVLKVKLGGDPGVSDADRLGAIRGVHDGPIYVDVNGGWTEHEAVDRIKDIEPSSPVFVEQPIERGNPAALGRIRAAVDVPIIADEDALDMRDLPALVGHVDGINIKLAKCGGPSEALRMIRFAQSHGWILMLGCMVESSIAITAASWLLPFFDHADLDGALLIANDPYDGARLHQGHIIPPEGPGIGVHGRASGSHS